MRYELSVSQGNNKHWKDPREGKSGYLVGEIQIIHKTPNTHTVLCL